MPRRLVWVLFCPEGALSPSDVEMVQALGHDQDLEAASPLTQRCRQMMRARDASPLALWLTDGLASELPELVRFARGLPREPPGVQAAVDLPSSHGQVERQSTTVTRLKRQSDGRATLDLLRQRMLHAA